MQLKNIAAAIAMAFALVSCDHDSTSISPDEKGNLNVEFDNTFNGADLVLTSQINTTSQNENLKINTVKYIISNIVLTKEDGTVYVYPKAESYFIVNESDEETHVLELHNIPAGNYTKIKFGIGVDEAQYNLGMGGQGDFLTLAQNQNLLSDWSDGYKFLAFEGNFTSPTVGTETSFTVKTGKTSTNYNYTEVLLNMPDKALVRTTITPEIHIMADVAKIIDGTNKIKLSDNNSGGTGAAITNDSDLALITANLQAMFTVNHVHND